MTHCVVDLLRHGDTGVSGYRGSIDDALTPLGWEQMRQATQQELTWHAVISSPMKRCAEFAKTFTRKRMLPLELNDALREFHFGDWEGKRAEQLLLDDKHALQQFWNNPWVHTPPNAERLTDFEHRVQIVWHHIARRYHGKRVLIITHGGIIRMLMCITRRIPRDEILSFSVPHASIHTLPCTTVLTS